MKHMTRSYPPENAMLRPHKESTLEKQQKKQQVLLGKQKKTPRTQQLRCVRGVFFLLHNGSPFFNCKPL
jgi:hypothetical protein